MTSGFGVAMARVDPVPQKVPLLTAGLSDKVDVWGLSHGVKPPLTRQVG